MVGKNQEPQENEVEEDPPTDRTWLGSDRTWAKPPKSDDHGR